MSAPAAYADSVNVVVPGAHCQMCVQALTDTFKANESVKGVTVDLKTTTLKLELKDGKSLDDKAIQEGVKAAGFEAGKIERM
jgi:copper chaperone CopZ